MEERAPETLLFIVDRRELPLDQRTRALQDLVTHT
jgi:hypothetical protein